MRVETQIESRIKEVKESMPIIDSQDDETESSYAEGYISGLREALKYMKEMKE